MSLLNQNWIGMDGQPITGRVPTNIQCSAPLNRQQQGEVAHAFKLFCDAVHGSSFPNGYHVQNRILADGTYVRMESNNSIQRVWVQNKEHDDLLAPLNIVCMFTVPQMPMGRVWTALPWYTQGFAGDIPKSDDWDNTAIIAKTGSVWQRAGKVKSDTLLHFKHGQKALFTNVANEAGSAKHSHNQSYPGNMDWSDRRVKLPRKQWLVLSWWSMSYGRYQPWWRMPLSTTYARDYESLAVTPVMGPAKFGMAPAWWGRFGAEHRFQARHQEMSRLVWCNGICVAVVPPEEDVLAACFYNAPPPTGGRFLHIITTRKNLVGFPTPDERNHLRCYWIKTALSKGNLPSQTKTSPCTFIPEEENTKWGIRWDATFTEFDHIGGPDQFKCNGAGSKAIAVTDSQGIVEIDLVTGISTPLPGGPTATAGAWTTIAAVDYSPLSDKPTYVFGVATAGAFKVYHAINDDVRTMIDEATLHHKQFEVFGDLRADMYDICDAWSTYSISGPTVYLSTRRRIISCVGGAPSEIYNHSWQTTSDSGSSWWHNRYYGPIESNTPTLANTTSYMGENGMMLRIGSNGYTSAPDGSIVYRSVFYPKTHDPVPITNYSGENQYTYADGTGGMLLELNVAETITWSQNNYTFKDELIFTTELDSPRVSLNEIRPDYIPLTYHSLSATGLLILGPTLK